jgi:hypothetical protein
MDQKGIEAAQAAIEMANLLKALNICHERRGSINMAAAN